MARFLTVSLRAAALGICGWFALSAHASNPPPKPNPKPTPAPPKPAPPAPIKAAATPPALPPPQEDYFARYGRILTVSDTPQHPFKLTMPFPGVGEVKVPSQDELKMREKLEQLATLSDDDIRTQLQQWPPFSKMSLADEGNMLMRIQQFKDQRSRIAEDRRHKLGLTTLTPDQVAHFEKEYWDKRLQMDRDLANQFQAAYHAREQKFEEELFREFSSNSMPLAQAPQPTPPPSTVAQNKPATPPTSPAPIQSSAPPVAQGPMR